MRKLEMIIEATQTFSPGNVELLIYLLSQLESKKIHTKVYLGHDYTFKLIEDLNFKFISIEKSDGLNTIIRFLKKRDKILFFCSYPPLVKQSNSLVYFHSSFFVKPVRLQDKSISLNTKLRRLLVFNFIKYFHKKVDCFYCQTKSVRQALSNSFNNIKVQIVPFYNERDLLVSKHNKNIDFEFDFFYPATPDVHKNYFRLFEAVKKLGKTRKLKLVVTIDNKSVKYIEKINETNNYLQYEAIVNLGRIPKERVLDLYLKSKALIYPSLEESLGLPLIEAAYISCPILGSDLPYIHDVVNNPITFNPYDVKDIADVMNRFLNNEFDEVKQSNKIENKVGEIINYFQN